MAIRIGIVGARRRAQGIGAYVARHLASLGAEVTAIVGTQRSTLAEAQDDLQRRWAIDVRGYLRLPEMLRAEQLDAVAICSPQEFHLEHLRQALEAGVHALCEKPLVFDEQRDLTAEAEEIVRGFAAAGKTLMVNAQWPYTLDAFGQLFPESQYRRRPPAELYVRLSPDASGAAMIPNSLPHAISLLLALAPSGGQARDIRCTPTRREAGKTTAAWVEFDYVWPTGLTRTQVELRRTGQQPRPAAYRIDGDEARRVIETPDYQQFFARGKASRDGGASVRVELEDPLRLLLADFMKRCESPQRPATNDPILVESLKLLGAVYQIGSKTL